MDGERPADTSSSRGHLRPRGSLEFPQNAPRFKKAPGTWEKVGFTDVLR